ncbi:hypothetical protein Bbelb_004390 [Branchiostoma belcheri]|nr:hypothetical protein Bbelb_004390 [Branchiostoma belcheri]
MSEVGFEPTPPFGDQNPRSECWEGTSTLESGALDHSVILTCGEWCPRESEFAAMDPAARIRWLGGQCAEFERRLQDAVAPELVPRFRAGLEELVVTWEREHGKTGEGIDGVAQLRKLRDWAVSNGKPSPVIDEFLATHTKFSVLQEDFREGILKPLKEGFPKHSCKKVRKVEKKLTTILSSWKDLLKKSLKVKDRTVHRTSTEKKESTHDGLEGLIPALQEKAQQALKLARKWGRLLEDDVLQQVAESSDETLAQVSMATDHNKTAKEKRDKLQADMAPKSKRFYEQEGRVHCNDKSLGAHAPGSPEDSSGVTSKAVARSTSFGKSRTTRHRKEPEVMYSSLTSTDPPASTTILKQKPQKAQEIRQNTRKSTGAPVKNVKAPALLLEQTTSLVVPKGKQTSTSLPSSPRGLFFPAAVTGAAAISPKHHRRTKSSSDQPLVKDSIQTPEENNRIRHPLAVGATSTAGQAGPVSVVGTNEAHGRVSSAKYRGDAGFSKGISDLKTEFEQIRQDALMYEYSLERERAAHIKKELTGMESRKREIKQKLQAEKATANFLTLGANVDRVRDRVGQLQTELARVSAKCVETEKRLQESSDRSVTLAAGIKLWSENKTSRRLEPIDRRASCKNGTKKAAQGKGKL